MMAKNVFIMTFEEDSKAYQAFAELKQLHATGGMKGEQMGILLNDADAGLQLKDFIDFTGADKSMKGSLIGLVVGIIGGPLGMLLGWIGGSFIGATGDAREVKTAISSFEQTVSLVSTGKTGLMLIARPEDKENIERIVYDELGGQVARMDADYVLEEVKKAQQAERELAKEAYRQMKK